MRIILLWDRIMGQDPSSSSYILVNALTSIVPKYKILILVRRSLILSHNGLSFPWDQSYDHHYFLLKGELRSQFLLKELVLKIIITYYLLIIYNALYTIILTLWALSGLIGRINRESSAFGALLGLIGRINHETSA